MENRACKLKTNICMCVQINQDKRNKVGRINYSHSITTQIKALEIVYVCVCVRPKFADVLVTNDFHPHFTYFI